MRGFTMLEILLVLALSFIGLLGLLSLQVVAVRANGQSRSVTEATGLAQDKLEALRRVPLRSLVPSTDANIDPLGRPGGIYTRVATVTPLAAPAGGTLVQVSVLWSDAGGAPHRVAVSTVRAP